MSTAPFGRVDVDAGNLALVSKFGSEARRACQSAAGCWLLRLNAANPVVGEFGDGAALVAAGSGEQARERFEKWDRALNFGVRRYVIFETQAVDIWEFERSTEVLCQP